MRSQAVGEYFKDIGVWDLMIQLDVVDGEEGIRRLVDEIQEKMEQGKFPEKLSERVNEAFKRYDFSKIIVRSSTGMEDRPGESFAGGYVSSKEITVDEIEETIKQVIMSYLSIGSVKAVKDSGEKLTEVKWGAGIQEFDESSFGGVVFSSREKIIFEVAKSPDKVVAGDYEIQITFNRLTGEISRIGNEIEALINDNFIIQFTELIGGFEKITNEWQDIEWLVTPENELVLLQRRE